MPKLEKMLVTAPRPRRRQTWEEQLAIMQSWSARIDQQQGRVTPAEGKS